MSISTLTDPALSRPYQGTAVAYAQSLWEAGATPVLLPLIPEAAEEVLRGLDGLLLSGGVDIAPRFYGEEPHPRLGVVDDLRDATEIALYRVARERGLPVLGICRGVQVINVLEGGSLHQHLDGHSQSERGLRFDDLDHAVTFEGDGRLARHHPASLRVNSHHHQAVKAVAPTLRVVARSEDGLVEALEGDGVLGVQWHPELTYRGAPETNGTFTAYMEFFR